MKINIGKDLINFNFIDEMMWIRENYKVVRQSNDKKVSKITKQFSKLFIVLVIFILVDVVYNFMKANYEFYLIFEILFILFFTNQISMIKNNIKEIVKNSIDEEFIINDKCIKLVQGNVSMIELSWDAIEFILIGKHTISFVPNRVDSILIAIPIELKSEVEKILEKYDKKHLIG